MPHGFLRVVSGLTSPVALTTVRTRFGNGLAITSLFLGVMAVFGVLAFHFPEHLTTPRLREVYDETHVRTLLHTGMVAGLVCALAGLMFARARHYAVLGLACLILAWLGGGPTVELETPVRSARFYISVDWVLIDLVLIATLFIGIERVRRLKPDQAILRSGWQVDLTHYVVNHLLNGGLIFVISLPAYTIRNYLDLESVSVWLQSLPLLVQLIGIMACTDFVQYWVHRASHRVPFLWRFHRIHHSVETMDWLAGSRLHLVDILITRSLSLIPMVVLGFFDGGDESVSADPRVAKCVHSLQRRPPAGRITPGVGNSPISSLAPHGRSKPV